MKKTIKFFIIIVLLAFGSKLNAQQQQQQQQPSDTITYWMEYNWDNLDVNDMDTIWNVRCYIQIPAGVTIKKFHLKLDDVLNNINNVCNVNSTGIDSIITSAISAGVYQTPHPKRAETGYQPTYSKNNNIVVADLGYHRNHYYAVEMKPKENSNNVITKVKKIKDIKY